jgi:hypothetical protein
MEPLLGSDSEAFPTSFGSWVEITLPKWWTSGRLPSWAEPFIKRTPINLMTIHTAP